jgi:hypothetical protein
MSDEQAFKAFFSDGATTLPWASTNLLAKVLPSFKHYRFQANFHCQIANAGGLQLYLGIAAAGVI